MTAGADKDAEHDLCLGKADERESETESEKESRQEGKTARTIIKHSIASVKAYKNSLKACRSVAVRGVTACLFLIKLLVRYWE